MIYVSTVLLCLAVEVSNAAMEAHMARANKYKDCFIKAGRATGNSSQDMTKPRYVKCKQQFGFEVKRI